MYNITYNGIITVNRGDSFTLPLYLSSENPGDGTSIEIDENSFIYFGVMEPNEPFENALIRKKFSKDDLDVNGNLPMHFTPQDTQYLLPGKYYYQIKLQIVSPTDVNKYDVYTIVDKTQFYILE